MNVYFYGIKGLIFGMVMAVIATYAMFNVIVMDLILGFLYSGAEA